MLQLVSGGEVKGGEFSWENSVSTKTSFPKTLLIYVIEELRTMAHPVPQEEGRGGQINVLSNRKRHTSVRLEGAS